LFFPAPPNRQTCVTHFGEMLYIPKVRQTIDGKDVAVLATSNLKDAVYIPCLLI
jgi:hypothetical protein